MFGGGLRSRPSLRAGLASLKKAPKLRQQILFFVRNKVKHKIYKVSRVTDPSNFILVGIPPKDLLEDVQSAWRRAGLNVDDCYAKAANVTGEWKYVAGDVALAERIVPKWHSEQTIPLRHRNTEEVLDPQPEASKVIHRLLSWIDRVDLASQHGDARPAFATLEGADIFPEEEPWWLTELSRRTATKQDEPEDDGDEDGPASSEDHALTDDDDPLSDIECPPPRYPELAWRVSKTPVLPFAHAHNQTLVS